MYLRPFILLFISSLVTSDTGYSEGADNLCSHYGDTCYRIHSEPKTFAEATEFCKNMNDDGHLAQIQDIDHNNHIAEQLQKHEKIESAMFGLKYYQSEKIYAYGINAYQSWKECPGNNCGNRGAWEVVFIASSGTGKSVHESWTGVHSSKQVEIPKPTIKCNCAWKSEMLEKWSSIELEEVKVAFYDKGNEVAFITFNGKDTDSNNWFTKERLNSSSWEDLSPTATINVFSIDGVTVSNSAIKRRFLVNSNYGGCNRDRLWFMVAEVTDRRLPGCPHDKYDGQPNLLYAPGPNKAHIAQLKRAEQFVVYIKRKAPDGCSEISTDYWNDIPCNSHRSYICEKPMDDKTSADCDEWKQIGSKLVKFFRKPLSSWDEAYDACKTFPGGKLVEIRSLEEEILVKSLGKGRKYHIGYRKYNRDSNIWRWNKEKPWTVDEWESQEMPTSEDNACISINESGYWKRISCNEKHPFVCSRVCPGIKKAESINNDLLDYKSVSFGQPEGQSNNGVEDQSFSSSNDEIFW